MKDFLDHVRKELRGGYAIDPEAAAAAVLAVVCEKTSPGEAVKLTKMFPKDMRGLWPADVRAEADRKERADQKGA